MIDVPRVSLWTGLTAGGLWLVLGSVLAGSLLIGSGCTEERSPPDASEAPPTSEGDTTARALFLHCERPGGQAVTFQALVRPDSLTLQAPAPFGNDARRLSSVRAASGAKYEGRNAMVWSKGDTATVHIDGQRFSNCTVAPGPEGYARERHRNLHFRAIGQEPGWLVEVTADTLRFAWAYGQHEVTTFRFSKETDAGRIRYRAETDRGPVRVVAEPEQCTDPMNGRLFSHTVTVTLAGDTHTGCGSPLP